MVVSAVMAELEELAVPIKVVALVVAVVQLVSLEMWQSEYLEPGA